jgi:hypothetical protein
MGGRKKNVEAGPALNYSHDRRADRWQSHAGTRPAESADYDGSSTLVRRSWFGRFLARKTPNRK